MSQAQLKHLGTDSNFETMRRLIVALGERCEIATNTAVTDVERESHTIRYAGRDGEGAVKAQRLASRKLEKVQRKIGLEFRKR